MLWAHGVIAAYKRPGRHSKLDLKHMLMILLMYYRHYVTQEYIGMLFDLDAANVCRLIKKLEPQCL
ncbi:MAG: transposase family protein [Holosporales bacterium]|nr:transposase family protein [Holosporales bacterium]